MKLRKLVVKNFKLLKEVTIDFSTDPLRPLTVVRRGEWLRQDLPIVCAALGFLRT